MTPACLDPRTSLEMLRTLLARGLPVQLCVFGRSMLPALRDGQRVEIQPLDGRTPVPGEVVALAVGGRLLVHRVRRIGPAGVIAQGDARDRPDAPCPVEQVLGRVLLPGGRRIRQRRLQRAAHRLGRRLTEALRRRIPQAAERG